MGRGEESLPCLKKMFAMFARFSDFWRGVEEDEGTKSGKWFDVFQVLMYILIARLYGSVQCFLLHVF